MKLHSQHPASVLVLAALAMHSSVRAAESMTGEAGVEEIVVTSSRVPQPLRRLTTSVSVLSREDIEARGSFALMDVLRQMPAVSASGNGGAGKTSSLRIRGEEGFRTLAIFDGIRLTDPSGPQIAPQVEHLLGGGVERVEILRGPQGLAYGADAGGIVALSSKRPAEGLTAGFSAQAGAFDTRQLRAELGGQREAFDYFLSIADFDTGGFNARRDDSALRDDDGYGNTTVHGRFGLPLGDRLRLDLVHRHVEGDTEFDGCFAATVAHDCKALYRQRASRLGLEYQGDAVSHSLAYADTVTDRDSLVLGVSTFRTDGELKRLEYLGSARELPGLDVVFGADWEEAGIDTGSRHNTGAFLEILSDFSERLLFTAGLRGDDNDDFGRHASYRLSGAWLTEFPNGSLLKYRAAYGTGFRAPSPYEVTYNAGPFAFPPASRVRLKEEASRGVEVGVDFRSASGFRVEAVLFDQEVEDEIAFDLAGFSGYLQDVGTSRSRGVELLGEAALGAGFDMSLNYTWNDTERPDGRPRLRRPQHLANLALSWSAPGERLQAHAFWRLVREAVDESAGVLVPLDDFDVLDLNVNYQLTDRLRLHGRIENVLDEEYQEVLGYNTPGSALYVGFRMQFP